MSFSSANASPSPNVRPESAPPQRPPSAPSKVRPAKLLRLELLLHEARTVRQNAVATPQPAEQIDSIAIDERNAREVQREPPGVRECLLAGLPQLLHPRADHQALQPQGVGVPSVLDQNDLEHPPIPRRRLPGWQGSCPTRRDARNRRRCSKRRSFSLHRGGGLAERGTEGWWGGYGEERGLRNFVGGASDSELLHSASQSIRMELEVSGLSFRSVSDRAGLVQNRLDMASLHLLKGGEAHWSRRDGSSGRRVAGGARDGGEIAVELQHRSLGEHHRALDDVLKLTDVPRPRVIDQTIHRRVRDDVDALAEPLGEAGQEEHRELGDVGPALAQRWHLHRKDVETIEEVDPEAASPDAFLKVPVGGRDDPHVDRDGLAAAHRLELLLLKDAQQLDLGLQGRFPDLVQEDGGAVGQVEATDAGPHRAPESALHL